LIEGNAQAEGKRKLFIFTCYGGCATGVAAAKACIKIWQENPDEMKIGCLPAVTIPWKLGQIVQNSQKRLLIDACGVRCGAKLAEKECMPLDGYIELCSKLAIRKAKKLPSRQLEKQVYKVISEAVQL